MPSRTPITVIIDDCGPVNTMFRHATTTQEKFIPAAFLRQFLEVAERYRIKGKFSLVPYPLCLGRIDQIIPGLPERDLREFLDLVQERIAPSWDLTPEILTHWWVWDLDNSVWIEERENDWSFRQSEETLTQYLCYALEILVNAGFSPNGITSPWDFGMQNEGAYCRAVGRSLQQVCGLNESWYFLHTDTKSLKVEPRVMQERGDDKPGVVSVVAGVGDVMWSTMLEDIPSPEDPLVERPLEPVLSADGQSGRVVDLIAHNQPVVLLTHWQSLFTNGSGMGLVRFQRLLERITNHYGDLLEWVTCSELALRSP